jgi:hypothetical protein
MSSYSRRLLRLGAFLCIPWIILPAASADASDIVQAGTPEEIISAILGANASGRATEIHIAPGDYQFSETFASDDGPGLLPPITGTVLLIGNKAETTRFLNTAPSALLARFINVRQNGTLNVRGISLIGGLGGIGISSCGSPSSRCPYGGGAALNAGGALWFENSLLSDNHALATPGVGNTTFGGAILSTGGQLHVASTTVSANSAIEIGGGIAVLGGTATLLNSVVSGNTLQEGHVGGSSSQRWGFGLYISDAEVSIDHSTISGNTNGPNNIEPDIMHGFGIFNGGGTVSITNSAIVENADQADAAGFTGHFAGAGGGIYNGGTMSIADSTVAGNGAGTLGGGIANFGKLTLRSVTVARNQVYGRWQDAIGGDGPFGVYPPGCHTLSFPEGPGWSGCFIGGGGIWTDPTAMTTILSTAVALNTLMGSAPEGSLGPDCAGVTTSNGYNAIGVATDCQLQQPGSASPAPTDQLGIEAELGDLTDDGIAGHAHVPILTGSPLIDAGGSVCAVRDQLGAPRADGDHDGVVECDVGAVEFGPSPDGSTLTVAQSRAGFTLVTSAGTWNFGTASSSPGNAILLNGVWTGGWATLLEVANGGQLYAQAGDSSWWLWNNPGWSASTAPPSGGPVSPDGSTLTFAQSQTGHTLVTGAGTWNFGAASNTSGNAVLLNGGGTGGWATLLEVANGGQLYAQASDGSWWRFNILGWSASSAPSGGPVSPDGSTLTVTQSQAGGTLVTSAGTWNFGAASNASGNAVLLNGGGTGGWATLLEVAHGGQLYAPASDGSWWRFNNPGWSASSAPSGGQVSPDGSVLTVAQSQAGGTLVTSAGTWNFGAATNASGNAVLLNGGGTNGWATLLEVAHGGQLYAQAGDGSWWRWNNPGWSFSAAP